VASPPVKDNSEETDCGDSGGATSPQGGPDQVHPELEAGHLGGDAEGTGCPARRCQQDVLDGARHDDGAEEVQRALRRVVEPTARGAAAFCHAVQIQLGVRASGFFLACVGLAEVVYQERAVRLECDHFCRVISLLIPCRG